MASIVQPFVDRSRASTRACLELARAPDAFVGKADVSAAGNTFDAADLFVLVPTCLALTGRVAANFEAGCLVVARCFALAFVMRISVAAGHPARPTTAAPQLSLSETQSCWQLISNRAMLLPYARGL